MKKESGTPALNGPLILLILTALMAPIAGGYVPTEGQMLPADRGVFLMALLGDSSVPLLSHALIALPIVLATVWLLIDRQVLQVPTARVAVPLVGMMGLILGTTLLSEFMSVTVYSAAEWALYGVAFLGTVACAGRNRGPLAIITAIFVGCLIVSLIGIREYGDMRHQDPTWRIFGNWMGPNALAAILIVGFILGLAVTLTQERVTAILAGIGTGLIGFAILLTQSKGGLGAVVAGVVVFAIAYVLWVRKEALPGLGRLAAVCAVVVVLAFGLQASQKSAAAQPGADTATALTRFGASEQTQEQSAGFRRLLWKGSLELIKSNPAGFGAGTYRFWSAKPGLTTQTHFAHNSFLQLGVESSLLAPIALLLALALWTYSLFRHARSFPIEQRVLRAGVLGAVAAIAAHSLIDSDLHYFGIGIVFFMLLGLGLLLSTDAVAPEYAPSVFRILGGFVTVFAIFLVFWSGLVEVYKSIGRSAMLAREAEEAVESLSLAQTLAPYDGEAYYLLAMVTEKENERIAALAQARRLQPSTRHLRALARAIAEAGHEEDAIGVYDDALQYDPNNLLTLHQMLALYIKRGDTDGARTVAKRLVAVESTPYFQVRSQPDLVPTETAQGRVYLARTSSGEEKRQLLTGALNIFREYARRTLPQVKAFSKDGLDYAGQGVREAILAMEEASTVARELAATYRAAGRVAEASKLESEAESFGEEAESLK